VLWIDDGAITDLAELTGPVYASGKYTLDIAGTISDAIDEIERREFDVVIVDIRLPPGEREEWIRLYQKEGQSRATSKLGFEFLKACFDPQSPVRLNPHPAWLRPDRIGVFTVEEKVVLEARVKALGVNVYHVKEVDPPRRKLVELIEEVRRQARSQLI
jgi:CheY-like chemotaxis protein